MIQINLSVTGTPTEPPTLMLETSPRVYVADLSEPGRAIFRMDPNPAPHGFHVFWGDKMARSVMPQLPQGHSGSFEGSLLSPPLPVLDYAPPVPVIQRLQTLGDGFYREDGTRWYWKGATDFRLFERFLRGEDITPQLRQRKAAGANLVRIVAMKANNTGWELLPGSYSFEELHPFWNLLQVEGLYTEHTVMCDTRILLPNQTQQQHFWQETVARAMDHPNVLLELINEAGHQTQSCNPAAFFRPGGVLASHGSGGTDESPVKPLWDFATYHARRESPPDARGMANYNVYGFESSLDGGIPGWPKPCPFIPDEGMKPADYGYDPAAAHLMGRHCALHAGGTFHTSINSDYWNAETEVCAIAFFSAIPD